MARPRRHHTTGNLPPHIGRRLTRPTIVPIDEQLGPDGAHVDDAQIVAGRHHLIRLADHGQHQHRPT
jgi:hypothetical protein